MERTSTKQEETTTKKTKKEKFQGSALSVRISFLLGILLLIVMIPYTFTGGFFLVYLFQSKVPLYLVHSLFIALAFTGALLGGFSFREGKKIYGIIGFILNLIVLGYLIVALVPIINVDLP